MGICISEAAEFPLAAVKAGSKEIRICLVIKNMLTRNNMEAAPSISESPSKALELFHRDETYGSQHSNSRRTSLFCLTSSALNPSREVGLRYGNRSSSSESKYTPS